MRKNNTWTNKEIQLLKRVFAGDHGSAPSNSEICAMFPRHSSGSVRGMIWKLGLLKTTSPTSRAGRLRRLVEMQNKVFLTPVAQSAVPTVHSSLDVGSSPTGSTS